MFNSSYPTQSQSPPLCSLSSPSPRSLHYSIADREMLDILREVQLAKSKSTHKKKASQKSRAKSEATKVFKKAAEEMVASALASRQRDHKKLQKKLEDARKACVRAKGSAEDASKWAETKWRSRMEVKNTIDIGIAGILREASHDLAQFNFDAPEIVAECSAIKDNVRKKLDNLKSFLGNLEKESKEQSRMTSMLLQVQAMAGAH